DQDQPTGSPQVRITIDDTNTGHPTDQKHFTQATQQHRPDQPGYQALDFQSHLQQQLNGNVGSAIVAPIPTHPSQEQALQQLQHHLEWYQQQFGHSPAPQAPTSNLFNVTQNYSDYSNEIVNNRLNTRTPQPALVGIPQTPVSHGHSHTVPNTPQHYVRNWPSPPPTDVKHTRSQSFQLDVAPLPTSFEVSHVTKMSSSPYSQPLTSFTQDSFNMNNDQGYSSSVYSSSVVDPTSPGPQYNNGPMPTLYEEEAIPMPPTYPSMSGNTLFQVAAGTEDDFNNPEFTIGGPMGMSPRTAMLHNLGEGVNCSIVDTGIPAEQVDALISTQDKDSNWHCIFVEDGKVCDKTFRRKENARSHVQNHLGDRQFLCNDCGKDFVRAHDMKRHAAIHKDDRPHICPCGAGFARHDALTRHRQRGVCEGALPGYEKAEEDKPKRGRPKKERPDMEIRTTKAKKARKMDEENQQAAGASYATSFSSAPSERSLPTTPQDTSDFDADAFINLATLSAEPQSWRDTPPTSPFELPKETNYDFSAGDIFLGNDAAASCASFAGVSSPENGGFEPDGYDFGIMEAEPGVANQDLFSGASSPSCGFAAASSPFSGDELPENVMLAPSWGEFISPTTGDMRGVAALERWLNMN
ncbi:Metallothionein expression activator, partial [Vermiconidia calcicola]